LRRAAESLVKSGITKVDQADGSEAGHARRTVPPRLPIGDRATDEEDKDSDFAFRHFRRGRR